MKKFEKTIEIRWSDSDPNRHVRHSAYYDYGAFTRIRFFIESGFDSAKMNQLNIGPIIFKEECSFIRELHPDDTITINLLRGDINEDGSRWILHHEIFNSQGIKSAHLTIKGAWMDLIKRKLAIPPIEMKDAFLELPPGEAYVYKKQKK